VTAGSERSHSWHVWLDTACVAPLIAGEAVAFLHFVPDYFTMARGGDWGHYRMMAVSLVSNDAASPWKYRLLNPLLAGLLIRAGASPPVAFFALTCTFAMASCVMMGVFLRQLSLSPFAARVGAMLFAVSVGGYAPLRRVYTYPDALTNFLLLAVLWTVVAGRWQAMAAALACAAFAKENVLLLLPFLAVRMRAWRAPPAAGAVLLVPVIIWIALRIWLTSPGAEAPLAFSVEELQTYWKTAMVHGVVRWMLWAFAYSMGPLWLVALAAIPANRSFAAGFVLYAAALVAPLLFTTDTERVLMLLFPLVFPLVAWSLDDGEHTRARVAATITVFCTLAAQMTFDWASTLRLGIVNAKDLAFLTLCIVPLAATWPQIRAAARTRRPLEWSEARRVLKQQVA